MHRLRNLLIWVLAAAWIGVIPLLGGCGPKSEEDFFQRADIQFEKGRLQEAVKTYQKYLMEFPNGQKREKALFRSGEILYYAIGDRVQGVKTFGELIQHYPSGDYAFQAREILAAAFRDEVHDYERAALEYRWLIQQRPESPKAAEFQFQIARCYFLGNNIPETILELGRFIQQHPQSDLVERAYDELGSAHMILGRPDQALFIFRRMIALFPESGLRTSVEFKIGNCYEEMFKWSDALKIYQGLLDRYENRAAVEVRIQGVMTRQREKMGRVAPVDYGYRPTPKNAGSANGTNSSRPAKAGAEERNTKKK